MTLTLLTVCLAVTVTGAAQADGYMRDCPGTKTGLKWYRDKIKQHRSERGLAAHFVENPHDCTRAAVVAGIARTRAKLERLATERWRAAQYAWWDWLPAKFARVGACETGYGRRPGNWQHDSGTYVSAFGIIRSAYDSFSRRLGYPGWDEGGRTPRQQYEVAAAIQRAYGWSAWGCGGA